MLNTWKPLNFILSRTVRGSLTKYSQKLFPSTLLLEAFRCCISFRSVCSSPTMVRLTSFSQIIPLFSCWVALCRSLGAAYVRPGLPGSLPHIGRTGDGSTERSPDHWDPCTQPHSWPWRLEAGQSALTFRNQAEPPSLALSPQARECMPPFTKLLITNKIFSLITGLFRFAVLSQFQ